MPSKKYTALYGAETLDDFIPASQQKRLPVFKTLSKGKSPSTPALYGAETLDKFKPAPRARSQTQKYLDEVMESLKRARDPAERAELEDMVKALTKVLAVEGRTGTGKCCQ